MASGNYQQIPANEISDPEFIADPSIGDGGTKRSLQERQWVTEKPLRR